MKKITRRYRKWTLPSKASFWGLIIGVLGLVLTVSSSVLEFPKLSLGNEPSVGNKNQSELITEDKKALLFSSAQELKSNSAWLESLILFRDDQGPLIDGELKVENLRNLLQKHYDFITDSSYGEEQYIFQFLIELEKLSQQTKFQNKIEIEGFEASSGYSLYDIYFLIEFMYWYLSHSVERHLSYSQQTSLRWHWTEKDEPKQVSVQKIKYKRFKSFVVSEPNENDILTYSKFLSLID